MKAELIKARFPIGSRVMLEEMREESGMPYGLKGTIKFIDDIGQIHVAWDNGSGLALIVGEDSFQLLTEIEETEGYEL